VDAAVTCARLCCAWRDCTRAQLWRDSCSELARSSVGLADFIDITRDCTANVCFVLDVCYRSNEMSATCGRMSLRACKVYTSFYEKVCERSHPLVPRPAVRRV
jgi:hypothetical protein